MDEPDVTLHDTIARVLDTWRSRPQVYFESLNNGELSKEDFVETQIQFLAMVQFFNRPMAALAARIPSPELRVEIVRNVWEENGNGELSRTHTSTFLLLLERLGGITEQDVNRRALWPEMRSLNTALAGACVFDDHLVGAATLGMIERMFCEISSWIARGIVERGWLKPTEIVHYAVHEVLDVRHAEDFFRVLEPAWNERTKRYLITQGLELGAYLFSELYDALFRARHRRRMLDQASVAGRQQFCD